MNSNYKIALLIDCDNVSHQSIEGLLQELAKYGAVCIGSQNQEQLPFVYSSSSTSDNSSFLDAPKLKNENKSLNVVFNSFLPTI